LRFSDLIRPRTGQETRTTAGQESGATAILQPHNGFSLISNEKLLQLYSTMLKCNLLEERIAAVQGRSVQLSQEAATVGVIVDLLGADTLAPSTGGWMQAFVKGLSVEQIASVLFGGRGSYAALNIISPLLGHKAQLDRAILAARENKKRRNKKIVAAFFGSACESPELEEAMRVAGKSRLPMLLVCHSNSEAAATCAKAQEYGFPGVVVDGDDAVAVYRVFTEAVGHARRGNGATLLECKPWSGPGRKAAGDPILNMERYLKRKGLYSKKLKGSAIADFSSELDKAFKSARTATRKKTKA
jgi:TPP-dependent pyruvate/acetoin dehydrogenase alpha subunit